MIYLKLHKDGKALLMPVDCIKGVIPPMAKNGKTPRGCYIVADTDDMTMTVDESFDQVEAALTEYEVEIIDVANDFEEKKDAADG